MHQVMCVCVHVLNSIQFKCLFWQIGFVYKISNQHIQHIHIHIYIYKLTEIVVQTLWIQLGTNGAFISPGEVGKLQNTFFTFLQYDLSTSVNTMITDFIGWLECTYGAFKSTDEVGELNYNIFSTILGSRWISLFAMTWTLSTSWTPWSPTSPVDVNAPLVPSNAMLRSFGSGKVVYSPVHNSWTQLGDFDNLASVHDSFIDIHRH